MSLLALTPNTRSSSSALRSQSAPFVRRRLSPDAGRALEILGHAIEYLADEYAASVDEKGPLGNADPRVAAIQILKGLNRAIYYAGTEAPTPLQRIRRWWQSVSLLSSRNG